VQATVGDEEVGGGRRTVFSDAFMYFFVTFSVMNGPLGTEGWESCECSWVGKRWGGRHEEVVSLYEQVCAAFFWGEPCVDASRIGTAHPRR
jgi:hypothetical protein